MPSPSGPLRRSDFAVALLFAAGVSLIASGCTLDFDQFDTSGPNDATSPDTLVDSGDGGATDAGDIGPTDAGPGDVPDMQSTDGAADIGDTGTDADGQTQPAEIGAECTDNSECGSGVCLGGYCTRSCPSGNSSGCPGQASCTTVGTSAYCLLDCSEIGECPTVDGRSLNCLSLQGTPTLDSPPKPRRRCLNDSDGDGIFDGVDNCPMTVNAPQRDQNDDGTGDACSNTTACPTDVPGGFRAYPVVDTPLADVSVPAVSTSTLLPLVGGSAGSMMPPADTIHHIDRRDGASYKSQSLPYGLTDQAIVDVPGSSGHVGTPGSTLRSMGTQFGRYLNMNSDGRVELGPQYVLDADHVQMATTGAGIPLAHGYVDNGWLIWRWDASSNSFQKVTSSPVSTGSGDRTWRAVRRLDGSVSFYTHPKPGATGSYGMRLVTVDATADGASANGPVTLPADASQTSNDAFHPALFPGPGDQLYAIDIRGQARGRIAQLSVADGTADTLAPLTFGLDINANVVSVDPGGPSVLLAGDAPGQDNANFLFVREVYPSCLMGVPQIDSDGDATPDLVDNCPTTSNSAQADADGDRIGNTCDPDDDNDGILDGEDVLSQSAGGTDVSKDTDNDTKPNASDPDDDGDGIPDAQDRLPLDTDNDWLPNHLDSDDDGDGYSDDTEQAAGTDPLDPLEFPNAGSVVYIERASNGDRTAVMSSLSNAESANTVLGASHNPHQPRFFNGADGLAVLSDAPGSATDLVRTIQSSGGWGSAQIISTNAPIVDYEVGSVVSNGNDLANWFAIRDTATGSQVDPVVSKFSMSSGSFSPLVSTFNVLPVLTTDSNGPLHLVGGAASCTGCLSFYTADRSDGSLNQRDTVHSTPLSLREKSGWMTMLKPTGGQTPPALLRRPVNSGQSFEAIQTPNVSDIHAAVSTSDDHVLMSARRQGGSFDLWLYNARIDKWVRLTDTSADVLGLDWAP